VCFENGSKLRLYRFQVPGYIGETQKVKFLSFFIIFVHLLLSKYTNRAFCRIRGKFCFAKPSKSGKAAF
jgi:hypothetical protein